MSDLISQPVRDHLASLIPVRSAELLAMEEYASERNFPIIGPVCGHLCYQLTRMIGARSVFELGSGFGYSTAFFARAVEENGGGVVHHVVWDEELSARAHRHLGALGFSEIVRFHVAEAVGTLGRIEGRFDVIFNDIEKKDYPSSLPIIEEKLRPGGLLLVDNMLWHGRIFDPEDRSAATEGVRELTRRIAESERWISSLIPIRDGLLVAWKRH